MIVYQDVVEKLKQKGYTTYAIRETGILSEGTMQSIREGKPVSLKTIDKICQILHCPIEEVVQIKPDEDWLPFDSV